MDSDEQAQKDNWIRGLFKFCQSHLLHQYCTTAPPPRHPPAGTGGEFKMLSHLSSVCKIKLQGVPRSEPIYQTQAIFCCNNSWYKQILTAKKIYHKIPASIFTSVNTNYSFFKLMLILCQYYCTSLVISNDLFL